MTTTWGHNDNERAAAEREAAREAAAAERKAEERKRLIRNVTAGAAAFVLLVLIATVAVSVKRVPVGEYGFAIERGILQGQSYDGMRGPGLYFEGPFDSIRTVPASTRSYNVTVTPGQGDTEIQDNLVVYTSDEVPVAIELVANFKLNQSEEMGEQLHRDLIYKFRAWTDEGWAKMLNEGFRQQIEAELPQVTANYTLSELLGAKRGEASADLSARLSKATVAALGGDFFCGPSHTGGTCGAVQVQIKAVNPTDPEVAKAMSNQAASKTNIVTARNNAEASREKARGESDAVLIRAEGQKKAQEMLEQSLTSLQVDNLRAQAALECARNASCTMIVGGENAGVMVNPRTTE
jgi:regulator of protease activity HflC (stomatin/prohibitin superfamily)